jgi:hypothetical protein
LLRQVGDDARRLPGGLVEDAVEVDGAGRPPQRNEFSGLVLTDREPGHGPQGHDRRRDREGARCAPRGPRAAIDAGHARILLVVEDA